MVIELNQGEVDRLRSEIDLMTGQVSDTSAKILELTSVEIGHREELALKTSQISELSDRVLELTNLESDLRGQIELKQTEIDGLTNELNAVRGDESDALAHLERKFQEELSFKDEQISQLNEDLAQSQRQFDEFKLGHEVNLTCIEQKYMDQLAALNEQHEMNSTNSDLEFESQISLKRGEIDRLRSELDAARLSFEKKDFELAETKENYEKLIADLTKQVS